ncbi:hypothetical protein ACFVMC_12850 [Nocardia sp. NPDC127579]|uniref:hypothetical protein n=1 Tax=Nocardia sp. NPDC127579 TaxID=3345402 RepID=UPI00363E349A
MQQASRRSSFAPLLALLATMLLLVLSADCTLADAETHAHPHAAAQTEPAADPHDGAHCAPHVVHCMFESTIPVAPLVIAPTNLLLALMAVVALTLAAVVSAGGIRGPPVAALPVVSGRMLLTRFCIARR